MTEGPNHCYYETTSGQLRKGSRNTGLTKSYSRALE